MTDNNSFLIINYSDVNEINNNDEEYQIYIDTFKYYMNILSEELIDMFYNLSQPHLGPPLFSLD
jgi:hypothetical protein